MNKSLRIIIATMMTGMLLYPNISVKANAFSRTETKKSTKTIRVTLNGDYANGTYEYDDIPNEILNKIEKSIAYNNGGFEGSLKLETATLRPVTSTIRKYYKTPATKTVTKTITRNVSSIPEFSSYKDSSSFPYQSQQSVKNPFTGKSTTVYMTRNSTKQKTVSSVKTSIRIPSKGSIFNYDKRGNSALGIMSNNSTASSKGNSFSVRYPSSTSEFYPNGRGDKVYLGTEVNAVTGTRIAYQKLADDNILRGDHLISGVWAEIPRNAHEMAAFANKNPHLFGNRQGFNVFHYDSGQPPALRRYRFRSEKGFYNDWRKGIDLIYEVPFTESVIEKEYAYTFTDAPELDYITYSSWYVDLSYEGIVYDMRENNLHVSNVKTSPSKVNIPTNKTQVDQITSVSFDVGYDVYPNSPYQVSTKVDITLGGRSLWSGFVAVNPNGKVRKTVNLGSLGIREGTNTIKVEVNGNGRIAERKAMGVAPLGDNVSQGIIMGTTSDICFIFESTAKRTENTWAEKWSIIKQRGEVRTDPEGNKYAHVINRDEDEQISGYQERYTLPELYFRSKYTRDMNYNDLPSKGEGWQKITNGTVATIKAGYGFELIAKTKYISNRDEGLSVVETQSNSYVSGKYGEGHASFTMISPSITETITPSSLYATMQVNEQGRKICATLEETTKTGDWTNETKTFELPLKDSVGVGLERKIYTENASKTGVFDIVISTPPATSPNAFRGYEAESPENIANKSFLYDYISFKLEILGQDDIKSHIGN